MSSGLRESRNFARRQRRRRLLRYIVVVAALGGLGLASYRSGQLLAEREVRLAQDEIGRLKQANAALEKRNARLRTAAETARLRHAQLKEPYESEVPKGARRMLLSLVDKQLEAGAKGDRLRFLISAAGHRETCDGTPVTRRFLVRTALYDGPASSVRFADGALTVTATGEPAKDESGRIQAWFDPARPISVEIARLGEKPGRVSGTLPMQHALVANGAEYRFSFIAGESRGFVSATADRCRFP